MPTRQVLTFVVKLACGSQLGPYRAPYPALVHRSNEWKIARPISIFPECRPTVKSRSRIAGSFRPSLNPFLKSSPSPVSMSIPVPDEQCALSTNSTL